MEESPVKTSLRIDTLAEDYASMWRILSFGEKRAENRFYRDVSLGNKIRLELELEKIRVMKVDVCGERLPFVEIWGIPFKLPFPEKLIKKCVERVIGKDVTLEYIETEGKSAKMGFKAKCPMRAEFYKMSIPKKGEVICGDSIEVFEGDDGYFYSILSDGMGSGRDAAVCSRLGTVFMQKRVSAGIDKAFYKALPKFANILVVETLDAIGCRSASTIDDILFDISIQERYLVINKFDYFYLKVNKILSLDDIIDRSGLMIKGIVPYDIELSHLSALGQLYNKSLAFDAYLRIADRISGKDIPLPKLNNL